MKSTTRFDEIATLRKENVHPKDFKDSYYIGLEHISQGTLELLGYGFGREVDSQKQRFYAGDVLFGKLRPYFRKVIVAPFDGICSTDIWVVKANQTSDIDFIKYWMASEAFIRSSTHASEGSRMPRAQWDWVRNFETTISEPKDREVIGQRLAHLDESITANKAISDNLEAIAAALFKAWFVDFEPVFANFHKHQPASCDLHTASLFPQSFDESPFGLLPKGWEYKPAGRVLVSVGGATPSTSKSDFWDGGITWTTPKDLAIQKRSIALGSSRNITEEGLKKISSGLLPPLSTLFSSRAPIGYIAIAADSTAINQGFIAFPSDKQTFPPLFISNWLSVNLPEIESRAGGTSFDEISKTAFRDIPFLVPNEEVVKAFREITRPLLEQMVNLARQNQVLSAMRDLLLTELLSGGISIGLDEVETYVS